MPYESKYSDYKILEVKNGIITEERNYNQEKLNIFKERQFNAFR